MNKRVFRKSFYASLARLIGVGLGAGAGSLIHQLVGDSFNGYLVAIMMAIISFCLMIFAEYEKEKG